MEIKNFAELLSDPDNPRDISEEEFGHLVASIKRFGDLGGFVFNVQLGKLAGAHQRKRAFEAMGGAKRVVITNRYDHPDRQGTVAVGHIEQDGALYAYREVSWDADTHAAAMIAANRIGGRFNLDKLAELNYRLLQSNEELLGLTGQSQKERDQLLNAVGVGEPDESLAPTESKLVLKVESNDEAQLQELFTELKARGLNCKLG